jgi:4-amino-4-deoxy-L-arabinose transferase-like glycosyltransferase
LRFLTLWLLIVAAVLAIGLGAFPLLDPDEGRNAEVAREMALTNDYVMPRLDALPYLDKPIVYFAAEAAAMEVLGPTETAARLPAYLFTLAMAAFVWWFARRLWTANEAMIGAIVTLTTPLTVAFSRTVIFDSALAFFITVAMGCFYLAVECHPERSEGAVRVGGAGNAAMDASRPHRFLAHARNDKRWAILAWAAIGFGVITKGPVAIALPLLVAIPYALWRKRGGAIWSVKGLIVFVLVVAPWVWAISRAVPDFLQYVLVTETMQRLATKALKRTGPPWYFVPLLLFGALPWTVVVVADGLGVSGSRSGAARPRDRETPQPTVFLWLWILIPFLFFSLSQSKRPQYILPLMPAIALLTARVWCDSPRGRRWAGAVVMLFGVALVAAPSFVHLRAEYGPATRSSAIILGALAIAGGAIAMAPMRYVALAGITIPLMAMPLAVNPVVNAIAARRSAAGFVKQLHPGPQTEIIGVEAYTGSMSFYLRRPVVVVTPDGEEFTSNYIIRHYSRFAGSPTLKPPAWLTTTVAGGDTLVIVRSDDAAHRAQLERIGLRLIATSARYVAYAAR